jgi:hypothetical protein
LRINAGTATSVWITVPWALLFQAKTEGNMLTTKARRIPLLKIILMTLSGAMLGFLYYKFIGCKTGACPISSNPLISTIYGAIIGLILSLP